MAEVLHPTYLPFTADQLRGHFAPVRSPGEEDRHLKYYRASADEARKYDELIRGGGKPTPAQTRLGRQMEKDERFWLATAPDEPVPRRQRSRPGRSVRQAAREQGCSPRPASRAGRTRWPVPLDLFFEVNLPSPARYRAWLRDHVGERAAIPYLKEQAKVPGARLEGATKADAMLPARNSETAVIFEAKVLSDISAHVTFDLARNQLARNIDVMLQANPALTDPLSSRNPDRTFLVLLTPALTQPGPAGDAVSKSRLYGWLMPAYQDPGNPLLRQHLPHRDSSELTAAASRLGWASWEDCNAVVPGACSWLEATPDTL